MGPQNKEFSFKLMKSTLIPNENANQKKTNAFAMVVKKNGQWTEDLTNTFNTMEGHIIGATYGEYEYKGKMNKRYNLIFDCGESGKYKVGFGFSIVNKGIINTLANMPDFTQAISISYYINNNGYTSASVRRNGERVSWKVDHEEIPPHDDNNPNDEFFLDLLKSLDSKLNDGVTEEKVKEAPPNTTTTASPTTGKTEPEHSETDKMLERITGALKLTDAVDDLKELIAEAAVFFKDLKASQKVMLKAEFTEACNRMEVDTATIKLDDDLPF